MLIKTPRVRYVDMGAFPLFVGFTSHPSAYKREMRRMGVVDPPSFVQEGSHAGTHTFTMDHHTASVITLDRVTAIKHTPAQVCAMLAHEAVHVKQKLMEHINEHEPSAEFEAYTVQYVTQFCIHMYIKGY